MERMLGNGGIHIVRLIQLYEIETKMIEIQTLILVGVTVSAALAVKVSIGGRGFELIPNQKRNY